MTPTLASITRTRYIIVVALRILAVLLLAYAALLFWNSFADTVMYEAFERGQGGSHISPVYIFTKALLGPGALAAAALLCIRRGPAIARWLVPLPRPACPECAAYPLSPTSDRCPECGVSLSSGR